MDFSVAYFRIAIISGGHWCYNVGKTDSCMEKGKTEHPAKNKKHSAPQSGSQHKLLYNIKYFII